MINLSQSKKHSAVQQEVRAYKQFMRQIAVIMLGVITFGVCAQAQQTPNPRPNININQAQNLSQAQLMQAQQAANSQRVDLSQYIQSEGNNTGRSPMSPSNNNDMYDNPPAGEEGNPAPYGANLFNSGYVAERSDGLNSQYRVSPGDKIAIQMWGAVASAQVVTVDNQGNIFIPDIGPVRVSEVPASQLNNVVTQSIKRIYPNNVNVYINLLSATPVSVYVSGPVQRPGQYAGLASDSLLFFLSRAGGIDPYRGSYRSISVLREGEVAIQYDLYGFLMEGHLPTFSFKDDDVILVSEQGPMVTVKGAARYPFRFELTQDNQQGSQLIEYARPLTKTSHVAVTGNRTAGPISVYVPFEDFDDFTLADSDVVLFNDDIRPQVISVQISGSYQGPSFYTLEKGARLLDLLSYIEVDPTAANYKNVYIKRESVVAQQKLLIEQSLQRLERSIFTAPASSDGEAAIRSQEAQLVSQFIAKAREIEPLGKVVVADNENVANIRLEQGDEIIIPEHTDLIQVSGEVLMAQAIVYNDKASIDDYIAWAGGFSERADMQQALVVHANGSTRFASLNDSGYWSTTSKQQVLRPGDQLLILPKVDTKLMQSVKDITQILAQIAITANVALN
ncbi:polysaccharide biosynthesis/export family protein [Brumicola nitratireducens]|uniref:Polysaccharide export protein n=1 Tax=Glaciecola nitratireducens (strain JCM 12485 / KCTC 12276 / FR1064) TaxID=1085623 RepID=G4QIR6_GLANF|nr:polysaccharide biosynthesis/export family protein [Glaciecola nitratireducens]AEP31221.1 polysaccharide export protein [Glaciecola nitratireducens FR1064]